MEGKREIDKILAAESPAGGLGRHYRNVHNMNAAPLFDYFSEYGGRRIMIALPSRPDGVYRFSNGVFAYLMTQEGSSVRIDMPPVCRRVVERLGEVVGDNDFVVEATRNGYREIRTTNGELEILINANMPFEIGLRVNNAARERFNSLPIAAYTEDTKAMLPLAREVGGKIPTYADDRYTLLLPEEFFPGDSLKSEIASYQDKFNIAKIATTDKGSPVSEESIVADILGKSAGIEKRTAALVPDTISSAGVRKLKDAGIRVLRIDVGGLVTDLRERYGENASYVAQFRNDTYATMLLARQIKADTPRDSSLYRLLEFYVRSHFLFTEPMAASDYIRAIVGSDMTSVAWLLKGILSYRPVWPYDAFREYRYIAEALISA
jgi:hypothetical protein